MKSLCKQDIFSILTAEGKKNGCIYIKTSNYWAAASFVFAFDSRENRGEDGFDARTEQSAFVFNHNHNKPESLRYNIKKKAATDNSRMMISNGKCCRFLRSSWPCLHAWFFGGVWLPTQTGLSILKRGQFNKAIIYCKKQQETPTPNVTKF